MNKAIRYISAIFIGLLIVVGGQLVNIGKAFALYPATSYVNFTWSANNETSFQEALEPTIDSSPSLYSFGYLFSLNNGSTLEKGDLGFSYSGKKVILFQIWGAVAVDPNTAVKGVSGGKFTGGYQIVYDDNWQVGTTYSLQLEKDGAGKVGTKWAAYLSGTLLGEIEVPTSWQSLATVSADQLEYIGSSINTCNSSLAAARVNFSAFETDGKNTPSKQSDSAASTSCQYSFVANLTSIVQLNVGATPPTTSGGGGSTGSSGGTSGGSSGSGTKPATGSSGSSHKSSSVTVSGASSTGALTIQSSTSTPAPQLNGVQPSSGSAISSTGSSLTTIKTKKHSSSALATAAKVTGIIILIVLIGWGIYLLFIRLGRKRTKSAGAADSDMTFDKTLNKTIPNIVVSNQSGKHLAKPRLTKDEYIGFGQEAILLQDLKDRDSKN